ncbi:hypothetical protein FO488_18545 [Geobacter sp. FeAm09]|uniref:hypothetical protein n=1 Tax=Geobacter sp. FeAm09 TaxID=2597769 RepID=UPI0011EF67DE|nr:hypothetical protein [Geobacter sp. FeAm09]QEM69960.1 hypothetical protein FO488_18545 [Geobacter sp. FeAm09]
MTCKRFFCLLACATVVLASTAAWSAEIHGRSSTQFGWFNDIYTGNKQAEFGEYLNLSITKIDKEGKLTFQGYGRVTEDIRTGEGVNGRLYYLYGDYSNLFDKVDIRLGRQFVNYAAGTALIDGGKIDLKNVGPFAFSVMGGRNVFFDLNGEATRSRDFALGAAAYLTGFKNFDLEASYFMKLDNDGIARDQVGGALKWYLLDAVKLYGNTRFDIPSETFSEVLAGIKYFPTANLVLTGEWYQSYPVFDSTSIFSVFAVDRYQEFIGRVDYTINDMLSVNAGYNKEFYGDSGDAADVVEVGCRIRPIDKVELRLNYDHRNGYGGNLNGGTADLTFTPVKPLELNAGIDFDVYERDRVTGEETARKYWLGGKYKLAKNMSASVRVEDNVNARYKSDWQGRAVFNYDF